MTREKKFFAPEIRPHSKEINKRWRVEYWTESGKRVVLYGNINKGKTVEERTRLAHILINSLHLDRPKERSIFEKIIEVASLDWRPKTISDYTGCANRFISWLGKRRIETVTEEMVSDYLVYMNSEKTNKNTIAKHRNMLHTLYNKCIAANMISYNPVKRVPLIKRQPRSLQFFSDTQIKLIKDNCINPQLWLAIQLLFYCFIRPGEQRGLKVGDINLAYGFIEVPGSISKNKKTEKVTIPQHFLKELQFLQRYPNNFYLLSKSGQPGLEQISTKYLNDEHSKVLNELKITGRYAFYSWKHTGVVKAVKAGINIKDLQLQLRHHSLDMVNEYLKNLGVMDSYDLKHKFPEL